MDKPLVRPGAAYVRKPDGHAMARDLTQAIRTLSARADLTPLERCQLGAWKADLTRYRKRYGDFDQ